MKEKRAYYRRLDIIRIIACIMVFLYHLNILKGGFLAVCTFFTLSGYLSCMSALKNNDFSIKSYYINRLKKIYLPLIVVVSITIMIVKLNSDINWINMKQETISVVLGYNNFWQLSANLDYFARHVNSPFMHLWYISILMQFDLFFPIVFKLFKKINENAKEKEKIKRNISTIVVVLLTLASTVLFYYMSKTQNIMVVYYNTFTRMFSIFFGVLLALLHYKYNFRISKKFERINTPIFIIYNIALSALCIFTTAESPNYAIFMILTTIISTRLIEYSITESKENKELNKHLEGLSKISYEVYLVQYPVIFFMQNIPINEILKVVLSIILTLVIACILHRFMYFKARSRIFKILKMVFLGILIIFGSYIVIMEKDHSNEMKELENRINENMKIVEQKNNEYMNETNEKVWNVIGENEETKTEKKTTEKIEEEKKEETDKKTEKKTEKKAETKDKNEKNEEKEKDENKTSAKKTQSSQIVGIGDSVLLAAINEFYNKFPKGYFDGKISRTVSGAKDVAANLKSKGKLGDTVILCLGTNGDYSDKKNKELMKVLGDRTIYWVNAVGADDPKFNERFKKFASNYPNIHIIEWDKVAKNHPEYLEPDKIHPNYKGCKAMVKLVYDTINN